MSTSTFNPAAISLGPGVLHDAPLGSTIPTDITTALDEAFLPIGYTNEGSEVSFEVSSDPVEVAESFDPVRYATTSRNGSVTFAMAENTVQNLERAFNGGSVTVTGTAPNEVYKYEPPEPGAEIRRILVWTSEDGQERWVFHQVFQGGAVTISRRKGAEKATLPVQFRMERPVAGGAPFTAYYAGARSGDITVAP